GDLRIRRAGGRAHAGAPGEGDDARGFRLRLEAIEAGVVSAQQPDGEADELLRCLDEVAGGRVLAAQPSRGGLPHETKGSTSVFLKVILPLHAGTGNRVPEARVWSIVTPRDTAH